jgi:hypothetical protein
MIDMKKLFFAAALAAAALPVLSQELWDPHLKLTAGIAANAEENYIAQNKAYGLALAGAYPIIVRGAAVFEGGYRFMPPTSQTSGMISVDDKTDIYYAGAMYRQWLWRDGAYLQAGVRGTNAKTVRTITYKGIGENGSDLWERSKADREIKAGWCFGLGYRLTNLWSFEMTASSVGFKNIFGEQTNATIIEAALLIHR